MIKIAIISSGSEKEMTGELRRTRWLGEEDGPRGRGRGYRVAGDAHRITQDQTGCGLMASTPRRLLDAKVELDCEASHARSQGRCRGLK